MAESFFKFPHTPHLAWLAPGAPRDDKVLAPDEFEAFLRRELVVEEKVDGANVGFSFTDRGELRAQNRGQYLQPDTRGQFSRIGAWMREHEESLRAELGSDRILFGEWLLAVHSVHYSRLPDWFLVFDVYDRSLNRFWSTDRRNTLAHSLGLACVPFVARGRFARGELADMACGPSALADGMREGVYLRDEADGFLTARAKLVNPAFVQQIGEHWSRRAMTVNELRSHYHATSPSQQ